MATVSYSLRIDDIERAVLVELEGFTREQVQDYAGRVEGAVQNLIMQRAENGGDVLAGSVRSDVFDTGDGTFMAIVFSDRDEAIWFEEGTGIHGPRSSYIFPRRTKLMKFRPYNSGGKIVFAAKVQGQKAQHPFRDGLNQVVGRGGALRRA